jgi:TolB-like protein
MRGDLKRLKRDSESGRAAMSTPAPPLHSRTRKGIESLAVLPLVNTSGDPDAEYLSEGIAESVINSFSQLPKLRVARQQKSFRYKGANADLQEVARELNVQAVLTGRILLRGDTLVVKMSLDDVEKDAQVWGQQYTKKMSDIFLLQDQIADEVLQALKLKLAGEPKRRLAKQTHNTDAYHLYLKGRFYWARRTPDNTTKALDYYQQAIEKDPNYALWRTQVLRTATPILDSRRTARCDRPTHTLERRPRRRRPLPWMGRWARHTRRLVYAPISMTGIGRHRNARFAGPWSWRRMRWARASGIPSCWRIPDDPKKRSVKPSGR